MRLAAAALAVACALGVVAFGPVAATAADGPPCPFTVASPPVSAPPAPVAPTPDADADPVGGERLGSDGLVLPANGPRLPSGLAARSWVLADLDTGAILAACAPHALHPPASTLKLLTALTALPKVDPKQTITVTAGDLAFEPGSSAVGLVEGGKYTIATVSLGMLLVSGNDAANLMARLAGGTKGLQGGIAAMNAEAARIGAHDTHAVTASGLDGAGQWTSAYDLALIARADFGLPDFRRYTAARTAYIPAQRPNIPPVRTYPGYQIQNDNGLLGGYAGAIGGKTGYTDVARHTYMGAASRNGRRLVITMMDGEHRPVTLWKQAASLLDWGFALPTTTEPVGHLVDPGEAGPSSGSALHPTPPAVAAAGEKKGPSVWFFGFGVVGVGLLALGIWVMRARAAARERARKRFAHRIPHPVGPVAPVANRRSSGRRPDPHPRPGQRRTRHPEGDDWDQDPRE